MYHVYGIGLHERFGGLLQRFGILPVSHSHKDLGFDDEIFPMASSLDPAYGFHWLNDHMGTQQDKEELRQHIIGITV